MRFKNVIKYTKGLCIASREVSPQINLNILRINVQIVFNLKSASDLNGNLNCSKELEHDAS